jgi:hypothetical protein
MSYQPIMINYSRRGGGQTLPAKDKEEMIS